MDSEIDPAKRLEEIGVTRIKASVKKFNNATNYKLDDANIEDLMDESVETFINKLKLKTENEEGSSFLNSKKDTLPTGRVSASVSLTKPLFFHRL